MYLVSQHSTGAPPERQHTTQEMAIYTVYCEYIQILCISTAETALYLYFDIFYYYNHLKVFNNDIAFKCLCHNYVCTCSGSCT